MNIDIYPRRKSFEHLLDLYPAVKASEYLPNWYKNNKINNQYYSSTNLDYINMADKKNKFNIKHAKNCPAIQDYISNGIVIRSWSDIYLSINKDGGVSWKMPVGDMFEIFDDVTQFNVIENHPELQIKDMQLNQIENYGILKLIVPYYFKTSKGYGLEFYDPFYHHRRNIKILPGIVETDKWHEINFPFEFYYDPKFNRELSYTIKAGEPLCMARPIKIETIKSNLSNNKYDNNFVEKHHKNLTLIGSVSNSFVRFKNSFKNE